MSGRTDGPPDGGWTSATHSTQYAKIKMLIIDPEQQAQNTTMSGLAGTLTLELPVQKPDVVVPVVELFLRE